MHYITDFLASFWQVILDAGPWLLLGLVAAGLMKAFIPDDWMARWLGKRGIGSVTRAALLGTPLPLCSCGVLPAALSLRKQGASRGATVSFLVATPVNGVDSISVSYALLGPFLAIVRPIVGIACAIFAGILSELSPQADEAPNADQSPNTSEGKSCCGSKSESKPEPAHSCCSSKAEPEPESSCCCSSKKATPKPEPEPEAHSCCSSKQAEPEPEPETSETKSCCSSKNAPPKPGMWGRLTGGLSYAMSNILDEIALWMLIGLLAAAAVVTFVPTDALASWGSGPVAMLLMIAIGIPMYICATASIPLATSLLLAGVSPGTVLVFLLAGPATNIGSLAVVRKNIGTPATVAYLVGLCGGAIGFGLLTDLLVRYWDISIQSQVEHSHNMLPIWVSLPSAILLIVLAIRPLRQLVFGVFSRSEPAAPHHHESPASS